MRQSNVMKAVGGERMFNMHQHSVADDCGPLVSYRIIKKVLSIVFTTSALT